MPVDAATQWALGIASEGKERAAKSQAQQAQQEGEVTSICYLHTQLWLAPTNLKPSQTSTARNMGGA